MLRGLYPHPSDIESVPKISGQGGDFPSPTHSHYRLIAALKVSVLLNFLEVLFHSSNTFIQSTTQIESTPQG